MAGLKHTVLWLLPPSVVVIGLRHITQPESQFLNEEKRGTVIVIFGEW